jgi:DASH complex subunit Dad3
MDSNSASHTQNNNTGSGSVGGGVSALEQEVLDEYARLARNMEKVWQIYFG